MPEARKNLLNCYVTIIIGKLAPFITEMPTTTIIMIMTALTLTATTNIPRRHQVTLQFVYLSLMGYFHFEIK